jgi:hypothetical protein
MKLIWQIEESDIKKVKDFYIANCNNSFVKTRIDRNINNIGLNLTKEFFWRSMVCALLTTQQKSGPFSAVTRFMNTDPFLLSLDSCKKEKNITLFVIKTISNFGGIRMYKRIGEAINNNFYYLQENNWELADEAFSLLHVDNFVEERKVAEKIDDNLKGFGPKQSRNMLQDMGLIKYEIPLDSRISKWLNAFNFPIKVNASSLGDKSYYNFILDGFRDLCKKTEIYPCVMDSVIFSSYDKGW